jgi:hypothetical protein
VGGEYWCAHVVCVYVWANSIAGEGNNGAAARLRDGRCVQCHVVIRSDPCVTTLSVADCGCRVLLLLLCVAAAAAVCCFRLLLS